MLVKRKIHLSPGQLVSRSVSMIIYGQPIAAKPKYISFSRPLIYCQSFPMLVFYDVSTANSDINLKRLVTLAYGMVTAPRPERCWSKHIMPLFISAQLPATLPRRAYPSPPARLILVGSLFEDALSSRHHTPLCLSIQCTYPTALKP